MSRLTYKLDDAYYVKEGRKDFNELAQKLGQYEDLEAELGIDLITLFKALKDGIYVDLNSFIKHISINDLSLKFYVKRWYLGFYHSLNGGTFYVDLKDYGKTWALSRYDLEEKDDE